MSYDESDEDGEWEVVDIVQTTTSVNPTKKPKPAKKEDVDKLAQEMQSQLSLKSTQLEEKMRRQERLSQQQMAEIQSKLSQIARIQTQQEQQQKDLDRLREQTLLEQRIKIESLSELTQRQIAEAHAQIERTQQATQNVSENVQTLHQLQQQQATHHQQQIHEQQLTQLAQTQQQLNQLAQLQQMTQQQQQQQQQQPPSFGIPPPPLTYSNGTHSGINPGINPGTTSGPYPNSLNGSHPNMTGSGPSDLHLSNNGAVPSVTDHNGHSNGHSNNNNNGWLPSFFVFGNSSNSTKPQVNSTVNGVGTVNASDMDLTTNPNLNSNLSSNLSPNLNSNISTTITTSIEHGNLPILSPVNPVSAIAKHAAEEKANILVEEDDDEVLEWNNEYGGHSKRELYPKEVPLYPKSMWCGKPGMLKTKGLIGEGKFKPNEQRQCGWILQNKSRATMNMHAKLECIGGDEDGFGIKVTSEKSYEFYLNPDEEIFILIEVEAPGIVGRYCSFYQLVMENGTKVGETLEVMCEVEAEFSKEKEGKIASLIKMGFNDRKKVVQILQKKKWNVQQSVDALISM